MVVLSCSIIIDWKSYPTSVLSEKTIFRLHQCIWNGKSLFNQSRTYRRSSSYIYYLWLLSSSVQCHFPKNSDEVRTKNAKKKLIVPKIFGRYGIILSIVWTFLSLQILLRRNLETDEDIQITTSTEFSLVTNATQLLCW